MRVAILTLFGLYTGLLLAQDATVHRVSVEVGKSPVESAFASSGEVRMELCSSGITLRGQDADRVRVSYDTHYGAEVKVKLDVVGNHADLRVTGCPENNFQLTIEVPKSSDLNVRMFAGHLEVWGITGDKDVSMSAGQLTMDIGRPEDYGIVRTWVTSGALDATPFDVHKGGLFRSFDKNGPGKYRLHAHVGAGQIELR